MSRLSFVHDGNEMARRRQDAYGPDSEGADWARALPAEAFDGLLKRRASCG